MSEIPEGFEVSSWDKISKSAPEIPDGFELSSFEAASGQPRSALVEIGQGLKRGTVGYLPKMAGQALEWASDENGSPTSQKVHELGKSIANSAQSRLERPEEQLDPSSHNVVTNALASGAEMLPSSLAPAAAVGLGLAALPEAAVSGAVGLGLTALGGAVPMGMSQAQETYENVKKSGGTEEAAKSAGWKSGAIETGGETVGTYLGGRLLGLGGKLFGKTVKDGIGSIINNATDTALWKPYAKQLFNTALGETATEMGQSYGEAKVEQNAGVNVDPLQQAKDVIAPTLGMTALLAPLGLAGHFRNTRRAASIDEMLLDPEAAPKEARLAVVEMLHKEATAANIPDADLWAAGAVQDITAGKPIRRSAEPVEPVRPGEVVEQAPVGGKAVAAPETVNVAVVPGGASLGVVSRVAKKALDMQAETAANSPVIPVGSSGPAQSQPVAAAAQGLPVREAQTDTGDFPAAFDGGITPAVLPESGTMVSTPQQSPTPQPQPEKPPVPFAHLIPAFDKMLTEIREGGVSKSFQNKDGETSPTVTTHPEWYQQDTVSAYNKKYGKKLKLDQPLIASVVRRVKRGKPLTDRQAEAFTYMEEVATRKTAVDNELVAGQEFDKLSQEGFEFSTPQAVTAGTIKPGDSVVIEKNGIPDRLTHKGYDAKGNAILKDGVTMHVDPFEQVQVIAQKQGESNITPEEENHLVSLVGNIRNIGNQEDIARISGEIDPYFKQNPHLEPYREMVAGAVESRRAELQGGQDANNQQKTAQRDRQLRVENINTPVAKKEGEPTDSENPARDSTGLRQDEGVARGATGQTERQIALPISQDPVKPGAAGQQKTDKKQDKPADLPSAPTVTAPQQGAASISPAPPSAESSPVGEQPGDPRLGKTIITESGEEMEVISSFHNDEDGMTSSVMLNRSTGKYHAVLTDNDSGRVAGVTIFSDKESADTEARKNVNVKQTSSEAENSAKNDKKAVETRVDYQPEDTQPDNTPQTSTGKDIDEPGEKPKGGAKDVKDNPQQPITFDDKRRGDVNQQPVQPEELGANGEQRGDTKNTRRDSIQATGHSVDPSLKYDGESTGIHYFTPQEGAGKGGTFTVKDADADSIRAGLDKHRGKFGEEGNQRVEPLPDGDYRNEKITITKKGRKWFEGNREGKTYPVKIEINKTSDLWKVGDVVSFPAMTKTVSDKYSTKTSIYPISKDQAVVAKKNSNIPEIKKWLGFVEEKAREGYLYQNGISKLKELEVEQHQELQKRFDTAIELVKVTQQKEKQKKEEAEKKESEKKTIYLNVPYEDRATAKRNGARFDGDRKQWYVKGSIPDGLKKYGPLVAEDGQYKIGGGSGYGYTGYTVGETIVSRSDKTPKYLTILSANKKYFREEGMSFGVGDENGYVYSAIAREATPEEAAPLIKEAQYRQDIKDAKTSLQKIADQIKKEGDRPGGSNFDEGKRYADTQNIYGGGEWFTIGDDYIWFVRNNGADGDSWVENNIRTGGAGGVGWRIPYDEAVAEEIKKYAAIAKTDKATPKLSTTLPPAQQATISELSTDQRRVIDTLSGAGKLRLVSADEAKAILEQAGMSQRDAAKFIVAWHGSPHNHDGFKAEKIGTGEGAQAYGFGHYFAGAKEVAEYYQEKLAERKTTVSVDGEDTGLDVYVFNSISKGTIDNFSVNVLDDKIENGPYGQKTIEALGKISAALKAGKKISTITTGEGKLYQVELAPADDEYLLWDKPLSEQSEKVRKALAVLFRKEKSSPDRYTYLHLPKDKNGQGIYREMSLVLKGDKNVSDMLHKYGIRGIKYLDGSSRGKGEGNYNFVIFDDADIKITAKYSENGKIQGFALPDGTAYIIPENIKQGRLWSVALHEIGVHVGHLAQSEPAFERLLNALDARKDEQSATGEAIRAAMARVPGNTKSENYREEVMAYLIEQAPEVGIARRFIALIKRMLVKIGISPKIFTAADFRAMAESAIRREAREVDKDSLQTGKEIKPSFAGQNAKSANTTQLDQAKQMQKDGAARREIWQKTGWWQIVPGQWSFEIDDSLSDVKMHDGRLVDALVHPQLFKDYPQLADVQIKFTDMGATRRGGYNPATRTIRVNSNFPSKDQRSTVQHEVQHIIQGEEGFATGAKLEASTENAKADYWRQTGEVESRLVQQRLDMPPARRKAVPPWVTLKRMLGREGLLKEGQAVEDVLISRQGRGEQMSAEAAARNIQGMAAFKAWFSGSVVTVDGKVGGEPLVVYHGSWRDDIAEFKPSQSGAIFFSSDKGTAKSYSHNKNALYPTYLSMKNPFVVDAKGKSFVEIIPSWYIGPAKANGHDGVIVKNIKDDMRYSRAADTYIVFKPTQIKSIFNEKWDGTNPDIMMDEGPVENTPLIVDAKGMHFTRVYNDPELLEQIKPGAAVELIREPENEADPDAIRIELNGKAVGYISRLKAPQLSDLMDDQVVLSATIRTVAGGENGKPSFTLEVQKPTGMTDMQLRSWEDAKHITGRKKDGRAFGRIAEKVAVEPQEDFREDIEVAAKGVLEKSRPEKNWIKKIVKFVSGLKHDKLNHFFSVLTLQQLDDVYGRDFSPVRDFRKAAKGISAMTNEMLQEADRLHQKWTRLNPKVAADMADIMFQATTVGFDPDQYSEDDVQVLEDKLAEKRTALAAARSTNLEPGQKAKVVKKLIKDVAVAKREVQAANELIPAFQALPKNAQEIYRQVRDIYQKRFDLLQEVLIEQIEKTSIGKGKRQTISMLKLEFDKQKKEGPYFPLSRFGDHIVVVKKLNEEGEVIDRMVKTFERFANAEEFSKGMRDKGFDTTLRRAKDYKQGQEPPHEFASEVLKIVNAAEMDPGERRQIMDEINQAMIKVLPDLSYRKHFAHRKGVKGYSQDAQRAFASHMLHSAKHIAKVKYGVDLNHSIKAMENSKFSHDEKSAAVEGALRNELVKRYEFIMNANVHPAAQVLTGLGFAWNIGPSLASAAVNLTQTPLVAYPIIASKFGFGRSARALMKAAKDYTQGDLSWESGMSLEKATFLKPKEREMFETLIKDGTIDVSQAHDLAAAAATDYLSLAEKGGNLHKYAKAMKAISAPFHYAEVANRQITALAAYRLAVVEGGHDAAVDLTRRIVEEGHFDYGQENRARIMQGNLARVVLLFKQYSQNMTYRLVRDFTVSLKKQDVTPEEKRQAKLQFAGIIGGHFLAVGALGLPVVGMFGSAMGMMMSAFGGDDEPWDYETELRNWLADTMGVKGGEMVARGSVRGLLPIDVAGRMSLSDLWWRGDDRNLEGRELFNHYMMNVLGPTASNTAALFMGMASIADGDVWKGVEMMVPKFVKDISKAIRYADEGVTNKQQDILIDELRAMELTGQLLGFTPARVAEMYEGKAAVKKTEYALQDRRTRLKNRYIRAIEKNDPEAKSKAWESIAEWNRTHADVKALRIDMTDIRRSYQQRLRYRNRTEAGIYLPKTREYLRDKGRFANTE